jgi:hypothetical protein
MGELRDALNAAGTGANASTKSAIDQAGELFNAASQRVNEAIAAGLEPGMPLDRVVRLTRQMPLQALGVAFLLGVMSVRRRRR